MCTIMCLFSYTRDNALAVHNARALSLHAYTRSKMQPSNIEHNIGGTWNVVKKIFLNNTDWQTMRQKEGGGGHLKNAYII